MAREPWVAYQVSVHTVYVTSGIEYRTDLFRDLTKLQALERLQSYQQRESRFADCTVTKTYRIDEVIVRWVWNGHDVVEQVDQCRVNLGVKV